MRGRTKAGARYAPAQRLEVLRAALSARRMTVDDMQELLEVSRPTVYRLLGALGASSPLESDEVDGRKVYRVAAAARTQPVQLTTMQMVALYLSRCALDVLAGTGIKEDLDDVFERVLAMLKKSDLSVARNLDRKVFVVTSGGRRAYDERLDDVSDAMTGILQEERLSITHGEATFTFEPYSLLLYKTGLYLAGYSHKHGKIVTLALDRCRAIEWRRGDAFDYPDGYHPSQLVAGAFGLIVGQEAAVRVRFDAEVAPFVERATWHPTQRITKVDGGAIEVTMTVRGTKELASWVLSFGGKAEILEPASLRDEIARELAAAAARYRAKSTPLSF